MSKTILIVDDNDSVRSVEKDLLEAHGYTVLEADTARDAIEKAIGNRVDLVIMDIRLPNKKRGIGAAKILRKNEKTSDVPIIFVTGYSEGKDAEEISGIPNHVYLMKPFKVSELLGIIKEKLK